MPRVSNFSDFILPSFIYCAHQVSNYMIEAVGSDREMAARETKRPSGGGEDPNGGDQEGEGPNCSSEVHRLKVARGLWLCAFFSSICNCMLQECVWFRCGSTFKHSIRLCKEMKDNTSTTRSKDTSQAIP